MKVLHLVHQYLPESVGGTELYTEALAQALAERGWQSAVFYRSYRAGSQLVVDAAAPVSTYAASGGVLDPALRFLATWRHPQLHAHWESALDSFRPDLVHVQHLMGLPLSLLAVLRERSIPYLVTLLDYWWLCANANLLTNHGHQRCGGPRASLNCTRCVVARSGSPLAWGASPALWGLLVDRNRQLRSALAEAAALLAPSEFVRSWYASQGAGTPQLVRWGVLPLGEEVSPPQLDSSQLNLLYVGGLAPNKGVHVLLAALRKVVGRVRLVVAGDETSDPGYVAELHQLADSRVHFVGRLNRRQVWEQMKGADAVLVPSLWHETFCLVAHEALAAGTPVVASALGALQETVQDGVNGFLLAPGDLLAWQEALQHWVDERQRLRSLRATVTPPRQFLQHVEQVESIYRAQLGERP